MRKNNLTDADRFLTQQQISALTPIDSSDLDEIYVFCKPGLSPEASKGYVSSFSSNSPEREGATLRHYFKRFGLDEKYPVDQMACFGRLDRDVSGLLVIARKDRYPKFLDQVLLNPYFKRSGAGVSKVYEAYVRGAVDGKKLKKTSKLKIPTKKDLLVEVQIQSAKVLSISSPTSYSKMSKVQIEINEGKHHQVKKMFYALGHPVCRGGLRRIRFGNLTLACTEKSTTQELKTGQVRRLFLKEKKWLISLYNTWLLSSKRHFKIA